LGVNVETIIVPCCMQALSKLGVVRTSRIGDERPRTITKLRRKRVQVVQMGPDDLHNNLSANLKNALGRSSMHSAYESYKRRTIEIQHPKDRTVA